jgi:single-strand DNA-binding protein
MNVNKVILVGRLTRDPEVRTTPSGQAVASIGLATGRTWTDKQGQKQEKTEFHNVIMWGRTAEVAGQYLVKGQEIFIEGRLESRKYTGKDGVERKITDVVVESFQFGSKPQGASRGNYSAPAAQSAPRQQEESQVSKEEQIPTINLDEEQGEVRIEDVPF